MRLKTIGEKELLHLRTTSIRRCSVSPMGRHVQEQRAALFCVSLGWPEKLLSTQRKFEKSLLANLFALPLLYLVEASSLPSLFPRSFPLHSFPRPFRLSSSPFSLSSRMLMHARSATVLAGPPALARAPPGPFISSSIPL